MPNSRFCIDYRWCSSYTCLHNFPYFSQNSISYSNPTQHIIYFPAPLPQHKRLQKFTSMKKYIALVLSMIKYMQKCYRNSAMSENIFEDHRKNGLNSKLKRTKAILSRIFGDHVRVIGGLMCPMWDQTVGRYSKRVGINAIHQKKNVKPFILNRDHILP